METTLGLFAFAIGGALDPFLWIFAAALAYVCLPRWWLAVLVGSIAGIVPQLLAWAIAGQPARGAAFMLGAAAVRGVLATLVAGGVIVLIRRSDRAWNPPS